MVSWLLAGADLCLAVNEIRKEKNLTKRKFLLGQIVSRDTSTMSKSTINRTSLESLSENFSDGFVAPLLFYLFFNIYGIFLYKMINTLDSMVGYKYGYYLYYGRVAARLDDIVNYFPARISAFFTIGTAILLRKNTLSCFIRILKRDSALHPSPNAGVIEACFATALNIKLGGPRTYKNDSDRPYTKINHWIGDGEDDVSLEKMDEGIKFFYSLMIVFLLLCCIIYMI